MSTTDTAFSHLVAGQATTWEWSQAVPAVLTIVNVETAAVTASGSWQLPVTVIVALGGNATTAWRLSRSAAANMKILPPQTTKNYCYQVLPLQTELGVHAFLRNIRSTRQSDQSVSPDITGRQSGCRV